MNKKYVLLLAASACLVGRSFAQQVQPCGTDEMHRVLVKEHPEILNVEAEFEKQVQAQIKREMSKIDFSKAAKTTTGDMSGVDSFWYDLPIVVHVVHDYNPYNSINSSSGDYIKDDQIFESVKSWNIVYAKQNPDTIQVIDPFKKYVGNPHIRLHLATKDPSGNPTKGITRRRNYLTYTGGQQAKFDDWPNTSYINIWFIAKMGTGNSQAAAYAHKPADAATIPYYDGVIALAQYMDNSKTINHEIGHCMNLDHVWGGTNNPEVACGDDNVDDTPPTKGHSPSFCAAAALWDTACSRNYFKLYADDSGILTLVNYPDTNNSQNIMDYTYCDRMFSKGQCQRMHIALNSNVAGRSTLWSPFNLANTGALDPIPDLKPIPDFTVMDNSNTSFLKKNANFTFPGTTVRITSQSWNDTITALDWTFSNNATKPTDTTRFQTFTNSFQDGGWVTVKMKVTGNHSGDTTVEFKNSLFVADPVATDISNYIQEFNGGDADKWVSFNYYNNEFKWKTANVGMYDNSSMMYTGFDSRVNFDPLAFAYPLTGSPRGDFDDLFSVPVNLSAFSASTDVCNLNFWYSGASRSSSSVEITDTLIVEYSANKGPWASLAILSKGRLVTKGASPTSYVPTSIDDWSPMTLPLPALARTAYTTFRFRYKPGVGSDGLTSTGNNFYMDRVSFNRNPAELSGVDFNKIHVAIVPNPTHGNAYVYVKDGANTDAKIVVTDITGKVVYTTSAQLSANETRIEIPQAAIGTSGIYLVQTITGSHVNTQKLVVY